MPRLVSAINNHTLQHDSTIISYSLGISTWCPSCELSYITVVDDQYCATMTKVPFSHFLICQKHCLYSSSTLFFGLIKTKCCSGRPMLSLVHVLFVIATCLWIAQDCYILYICSTKQFFSSIDYESASSFLYTLCWFSISVCLDRHKDTPEIVHIMVLIKFLVIIKTRGDDQFWSQTCRNDEIVQTSVNTGLPERYSAV